MYKSILFTVSAVNAIKLSAHQDTTNMVDTTTTGDHTTAAPANMDKSAKKEKKDKKDKKRGSKWAEA